jgi:ribosomal protein S18 acetylase RimI-like enzyme
MDTMTVEIRSSVEGDLAALLDLFGRAGEGAPSASLWGHEPSEAAVYLRPYIDLEPESLLIALVDGKMVGYLAGCIDSASFPSESERMQRAITDYRLFLRPRPIAFFLRATWDLVAAKLRHLPTAGDFHDPQWPSHLHINAVPDARGTGVAEALMRRWMDQLTDGGSPGCHLQTVVENTRAMAFFERMGFIRHGPTPVVPGARQRGRRLHQQTMIWTAPTS